MSTATVSTPAITAESFTISRTVDLSGIRKINAFTVVSRNDDGTQHRVELTVSHSKESKAFVATLTRVTYEPPRNGSMFSSAMYEPFADSRRIMVEPVGRYSTKAHRAAYAKALDLAVTALGGDLSWLLSPRAAD